MTTYYNDGFTTEEQPDVISERPETSGTVKGEKLSGASYLLSIYGLFLITILFLIANGERSLQLYIFSAVTVGFVLMFRYPEMLLAAGLALPFLPIFSYRGITLLVVSIALMFLAFVWKLWQRPSSFANLHIMLLLLFFLYIIANWYLSRQANPEDGISNLKFYFIRGIAPMFLIMTFDCAHERFRRFLSALAIFSVFTAIMILSVHFGVGKLTRTFWGGSERISLFGLNPISLSLPMGVASVALIYFSFGSKSLIIRICSIISAGLVIAAIFPTGSRQTVLCMAIAILIYTLFAYRSFFGKAFRTVVMSAVIAIVFALFAANYHNERFDLASKGYFRNESFTGRLETFKRGMETFSSAPVFGVGAGGHGKYIYKTDPYTGKQSKEKEHIHNLFVELLAEQGIFGFVLFLLPLCLVVARTAKSINNSRDDQFRHVAALMMALMGFAVIQSNISGGLGISGAFVSFLVAWMSIVPFRSADQSEIIQDNI